MRIFKWFAVSIAIAVFLTIIGVLSLHLRLHQDFMDPYLAVFKSPTRADVELWLIEEGFQDRGIVLHVKSGNVKPIRVGVLDWDGLYMFSHLQWTQDGQVAVFGLRILGGEYPTLYGFAYDFSKEQVIFPQWHQRSSTERRPVADWEEHEKKILALAREHGGLRTPLIDRKEFNRKKRSVWPWQTP